MESEPATPAAVAGAPARASGRNAAVSAARSVEGICDLGHRSSGSRELRWTDLSSAKPFASKRKSVQKQPSERQKILEQRRREQLLQPGCESFACPQVSRSSNRRAGALQRARCLPHRDRGHRKPSSCSRRCLLHVLGNRGLPQAPGFLSVQGVFGFLGAALVDDFQEKRRLPAAR